MSATRSYRRKSSANSGVPTRSGLARHLFANAGRSPPRNGRTVRTGIRSRPVSSMPRPQRVVEPDAGPARYLLEQNDRRIGKRRDAQIAAIGIGPENAETEISFIVFHRSNGCEEFDLFRAGIVRAGIVVPVSKKDNTMVSSIVSEANDFRD
mgnify:CR=1 FL=1